MFVNPAECAAAGLDVKQVERIGRNLEKWILAANEIGLKGFGAGEATLRFMDDPSKGDLIVAHLSGSFDGGAGDQQHYGDGLIRGET